MKKKVYELIGRATTVLTLWGIASFANYKLLIFLLDNCCTTLR